jgi:UDP-GlcNAc:undecaprenyl-phosphate GlcNAc-1-phosphate transferase
VSGKRLRSALAAAAAARLSYSVLGSRPPAGKHTWVRTNHRGEPITLLEGPAVAIGGVTGAILGSAGSPAEKLAMAVAGAGAAAFGGYDDLAGDGSSKGFRGHLGALRRGELTTGAVKVAGIGATGLTAALIAGSATGPGSGGPGGGGPGQRGSLLVSGADAVINTALVAGLANLLNLFDLRPGRAIKVAIGTSGLMTALPGTAGDACVAPLAAAVALLPEDLGERSMLGDAGANAIGAMLGVAATRLPRSARVAALVTVVGLTAASEVVSFTRVIERTGPLRWLDMLGRRPAAQSSSAAGPSPSRAARKSAVTPRAANGRSSGGLETTPADAVAREPGSRAAGTGHDARPK